MVLTKYEIQYLRGGHSGPYFGHAAAFLGAMRYLNGIPDSSSVIIVPYGTGREIVPAVIVDKTRHCCGCNLCPAYGEVFFHVRMGKSEVF